ncbi:MAG TPA: hypothetical protein ENL16_03005 [Candidatus Woesearchaeota archaeon]|nr:hypothetical protein [Candidatus Woesearchaeota archaeon]
MNKKTIMILSYLLLLFVSSNLASAVIFNIEEARKAEWARFETYKQDYIKFYDLEAFSNYVSDSNLARNFGFYGPDYYYIPPSVLRAKYNPPLQGEIYYTPTRGYDSSLYRPSAIKYYGEKNNGRYTGFIPSTLNGKYFDHPDIYGDSYLRPHTFHNVYTHHNIIQWFYSQQPAYYARIAEPISGGFYIIGFY